MDIKQPIENSFAPSSRYTYIDSFLGQGTYGKVEKAIDNETGIQVAIKRVKVKLSDDRKIRTGNIFIGEFGIHFTTVREIKVMREIKHPNLMGVHDIFIQGEFMNLVMDIMETDLQKVLSQNILFNEAHIKCIMQQILKGISELHKWHITHRDLSAANIFLNKEGICKVADFGLSRPCIISLEDVIQFNGKKVNWKEQLTNKVVTLWYRAPELIYGAKKYGHSVDMWSVGCLLAELITGQPLFPGNNEIDQLSRIFTICGTPSQENWPDADYLQSYFPFTFKKRKNFEILLPNQSQECINLLESLLQLDPVNRLSAKQALSHPYFSTIPIASSPKDLPLNINSF